MDNSLDTFTQEALGNNPENSSLATYGTNIAEEK